MRAERTGGVEPLQERLCRNCGGRVAIENFDLSSKSTDPYSFSYLRRCGS